MCRIRICQCSMPDTRVGMIKHESMADLSFVRGRRCFTHLYY